MGVPQLREAMKAVEHELVRLVPEDLAIPVADDLVGLLARCERQLSAVRVRIAHRVTQADGHRRVGDRDAASYLSRLSGSPRAKAKAELHLAEHLSEHPEVEQAYGEGRLSSDQARVVVRAATANPQATADLLATAETGSFSELTQAAVRAERALRCEEDEVARERRLSSRRYCRTWTPEEGGLRVDALLPTVEGGRLLAALNEKTAELMSAAGEPPERLRADALVDLCCGSGVHTELMVHVDAAALVRGEREGEELCEVEGVGPVSVTAARALLGEAFMTLLVHKGADIATVTSTTRVIPRKVRKALEARDRCCVVPGCTATLFLEIDHWRKDFGERGLTALDNLCRLCSIHHKMKTVGMLHLLGGPGKWAVTMTPPPIRQRAGPWTARGRRAPAH